ncbi:transposase [Thioclava kandeliae]|uniref:Transposase n=1 Tax=Thioclava kandeliae TaxID=3070818 RepID=A0ABV1SMI8_9RHOB
MKNTRFTEVQIMGVLRQVEGGVPAAELCREHGMSSTTLYKWRAKYRQRDEGDSGGESPPEAHVC